MCDGEHKLKRVEGAVYRYLFAITLTIVATAAISTTGAPANSPGKSDQDKTSEQRAGATEKKPPLRREGESYESVGRFVQTGDRYMFYPADQGPALRILENLGLERIARVLDCAQRRAEPTWNVSGVIYEFRGSNYLLVERALVKGPTRLGEHK